MKTIITTAAAALFAANVGAVEIYQGFADGNSDLTTQRVATSDFAGAQPSIGDGVSRYQGWAEGNPVWTASGTRAFSVKGAENHHRGW